MFEQYEKIKEKALIKGIDLEEILKKHTQITIMDVLNHYRFFNNVDFLLDWMKEDFLIETRIYAHEQFITDKCHSTEVSYKGSYCKIEMNGKIIPIYRVIGVNYNDNSAEVHDLSYEIDSEGSERIRHEVADLDFDDAQSLLRSSSKIQSIIEDLEEEYISEYSLRNLFRI